MPDQPAPKFYLNMNFGVLAGYCRREQSDAAAALILQAHVEAVVRRAFDSGSAHGCQFLMDQLHKSDVVQGMLTRAYLAGRRAGEKTVIMPDGFADGIASAMAGTLAAALQGKSEQPVHVHVAAPQVDVHNQVIVPQRTVIAEDLGDGRVRMTPEAG